MDSIEELLCELDCDIDPTWLDDEGNARLVYTANDRNFTLLLEALAQQEGE